MDVKALAIEFIKKNKRSIREKFAHDKISEREENPFSIFMAGSMGAGKTEFSKNLLKIPHIRAVRIDADEIKEFIPYYNGKNANQIQGASALGVEYIHDHVLEKKKSMVMDGTFSNLEKALKNIERSLKKNRPIEIFYIYQDPLLAWKFAKAREEQKGRAITKKAFIDSFFNSRKTTQKIKQIFGDKIILNLVVKSYEDSLEDLFLNINNLDKHLPVKYTRSALIKVL